MLRRPGFLTAALLLAPAFVRADPARILVGPDILVSRDGDVPHVETVIAVDPRDPQKLLGAAITRTGQRGGSACRIYASADGGNTWSSTELREQAERGGVDPLVGFTRDGTALFAALGAAPDAAGALQESVAVYRSTDSGRNWGRPFPAGGGEGHDHPQMAIDTTGGRFSGNVYFSTLFGDEERPLLIGLLRSVDGGRTFTSSVIADGGKDLLLWNASALVLSDGTLAVTLVEKRNEAGAPTALTFMTSTDGGQTFSPRRTIAQLTTDLEEGREATLPQLAVDPSSRFLDRIYAVWTDFCSGRPRILLTWSPDRGATWSAPRPVDPAAPETARQLQPAVAVNADGVVAVSWLDTRRSPDASRTDQMLAASMDGGATFLPPVRISSDASPLLAPGNMTPGPLLLPSRKGKRVAISTVAGRWPLGGDYTGLATGADGAFHLLWADSRTGTFQLHTARALVLRDGSMVPPPPAGLTELAVTDRVELLFDPATYDPVTREAVLPVRLRNTSAAPIWGPVRLEIGEIHPPSGKSVRATPLEILGAANGKTGAGAVFDLTPVLGGWERLDPGAVSGAVALHLRYAVTDPRPDFELAVYGRALPLPSQ